MTEINKQFETLLYELKDKGIITDWYYNGEYHWKFADLQEKSVAYLGNCIIDIQEKQIAELKAQIDKLKGCSNCDNYDEPERCADCKNKSKWFLKE